MAGGKTVIIASLNITLFHHHLQPNGGGAPRKSVLEPSWVVKTESNVNREIRSKPEPPCVVCGGCGRVDCHRCRGRGRTNSVHLAMLPKGEWPQWCRTCGGSGLDYCFRCKGSGEYRKAFGLHFLNDDDPPPTTRQTPPDNAGDASSGTIERLMNNNNGP